MAHRQRELQSDLVVAVSIMTKAAPKLSRILKKAVVVEPAQYSAPNHHTGKHDGAKAFRPSPRNLTFGSWDSAFAGDSVLAAPMLDRILHHLTIKYQRRKLQTLCLGNRPKHIRAEILQIPSAPSFSLSSLCRSLVYEIYVYMPLV